MGYLFVLEFYFVRLLPKNYFFPFLFHLAFGPVKVELLLAVFVSNFLYTHWDILLLCYKCIASKKKSNVLALSCDP